MELGEALVVAGQLLRSASFKLPGGDRLSLLWFILCGCCRLLLSRPLLPSPRSGGGFGQWLAVLPHWRFAFVALALAFVLPDMHSLHAWAVCLLLH